MCTFAGLTCLGGTFGEELGFGLKPVVWTGCFAGDAVAGVFVRIPYEAGTSLGISETLNETGLL